MKRRLVCVMLAGCLAAGVVSGVSRAQEAARNVVQIKLDAIPQTPPTEMGSASFDTTDGWTVSGLQEDKPMTYGAVTGADQAHEGKGAIRFTLNTDIGPMGMKYFHLDEKLKGKVAGSDGYSFWVKSDGGGGTLEIRLSQSDWSAWDCVPVPLNFTGWKKVVVLKDECAFQNWGHNGRNWDKIRIFAVRYAGKSGSILLDDVRFYNGTAALKVNRLPALQAPVTLTVDAAKELPAIPDNLKGVDFALINWGASGKDMNFGAETTRLFNESGAKLVRFWTYCPPLEVSPIAGQYDWMRFDAQMQKITDAGAATIMTCCFTPAWLSVDGTKEGMPKDFAAYEKLIADTVTHCKEKKFNVAYWEVWNEPNLNGGFLKGKMADLLTVYSHFAKAVRSADADAVVGATGLAGPDMVWIRGIVEYADNNDVPLDFVSWHVYDLMPEGLAASIEAAKKILAEHPKFARTKMIIDEWQSTGGPKNQYDTEYAAAYQIAALHRMLDGGLAAQTFFAFKESTPDFAAGADMIGEAWGMITRGEIPKASYNSFKMFAHMTGPRIAVSGGDGETNAIATRDGDAIDVLIYRINTDENAGDRTVRLNVPGWTGGPMHLNMELIDNAHSNALFNRSMREVQKVGEWAPISPADLAKIDIALRPVAVTHLRITPETQLKGERPFKDGLPKNVVLVAGQSLKLPAAGASGEIKWIGPRGWQITQEGGVASVVVPSTERTTRRAYFTASTAGGIASFAADLITAGVDVHTQLDSAEPWKAGTTRQVTVLVRNALGLGLKGTLSLWGNKSVQIEPAQASLDFAAGAGVQERSFTFQAKLAGDVAGDAAMLYPQVKVTTLLAGEKQAPFTVAYPNPLAAPVKDAYTTFLSSFASADAIAKPEVGPAGKLDKPEGFEDGKFGKATLLKQSSAIFSADALPSSLGTLELWVTPKWDGKDAPGWGTLFLRSGAEWAHSMWDLHIVTEGNRKILQYNLQEEDGRSHAVAAEITGWKAAEPHDIMLTWNRFTGRMAIYVDGKLAQEQVVEGGLSLSPVATDMTFNKTGGRAASNCLFGPVRISNVERIPGEQTPVPSVVVRAVGVEVKTAGN